MKRKIQFAAITMALASVAGFGGCSEHDGLFSAEESSHHDHDGHGHDHDGHKHDHDNDHGAHGPRGGRLVELGNNHELHAEIVTEKDGRTVRLYIMDHDMELLAVDAGSAQLNLIAAGEPFVYRFNPMQTGTVSPEFVLESAELWEHMEEESYSLARLNVMANGYSHVGTVDHHEHAHAGGTHRH